MRPGIDLVMVTVLALISAPGAGPAGSDGKADQPAGLALALPYSRGKIPVILIHGLGSSPKSWVPMIEALEADPSLRELYQFWTFGYATCAPILYSAHLLRQSLRRARRVFDPDGRDAAFDRMVVVRLSASMNWSSNLAFRAANRSTKGTSLSSRSAAPTYRPGVST